VTAISGGFTTAATAITPPHIEYGQLLPMLLVFAVAVAGTLSGRSEQPRIVGIDDHIVDLPPSRHMLVVRNDDRPGMIGAVGTTLGEAGVNIADMSLGRGPTGEHALMVLSTDSTVGPDVVERLRARPGILESPPDELLEAAYAEVAA